MYYFLAAFATFFLKKSKNLLTLANWLSIIISTVNTSRFQVSREVNLS
nr:MAG TPA: hypothetical protein [Caudoviricetes sp.]